MVNERSSPRVNIGCGQTPIRGWINFDSSPSVLLARLPGAVGLTSLAKSLGLLAPRQAEYILFCKQNQIRYGNGLGKLPLPSQSCAIFYSSHVLEHLTPQGEASKFLLESHRILMAGGRIRLAVPDLDLLIRQYLEHGNANRFLSSLHILNQSSPKGLMWINQWVSRDRSLHRWVYNQQSLIDLLKSTGFAEPLAYPAGETGIADPGTLNLRERAWESLYVEAVKV